MQVNTSSSQVTCICVTSATFCDLHELVSPFGHSSQVCFASLVLQICVDLQQLASPFGQGLTQMHILGWIKTSWKPNFEQESLTSFLHRALQRQIAFTTLNSLPCHLHGLASAKRNKYKTRVNPSNMIPITINHLKQTNKRLTVSLKIKIPASEKRVAKWWLLFRWRNVLKSEE